eukprot:m.241799 g.241799  ORF g.241799 m.241799 type:complete len:109 (+) comp26903_c0_seq1:309-635(+)
MNNCVGKVQGLVSKLHAVRLVKSPIREPKKFRKTLESMQLTKINEVQIMKNTASVNGKLQQVIHLVDVKPVVFKPDVKPQPGQPIVTDDGCVLGFTEEHFVQYVEGKK